MSADAATDMRSNDDGDEVGGAHMKSCGSKELVCLSGALREEVTRHIEGRKEKGRGVGKRSG